MVASLRVAFVLLSAAFCVTLPSCQRCDSRPANCELNPEPGPCFAAIPKFYFDQEDGECKEFTWGGCGGTVPFDSMEECQCQCQ